MDAITSPLSPLLDAAKLRDQPIYWPGVFSITLSHDHARYLKLVTDRQAVTVDREGQCKARSVLLLMNREGKDLIRVCSSVF